MKMHCYSRKVFLFLHLNREIKLFWGGLGAFFMSFIFIFIYYYIIFGGKHNVNIDLQVTINNYF